MQSAELPTGVLSGYVEMKFKHKTSRMVDYYPAPYGSYEVKTVIEYCINKFICFFVFETFFCACSFSEINQVHTTLTQNNWFENISHKTFDNVCELLFIASANYITDIIFFSLLWKMLTVVNKIKLSFVIFWTNYVFVVYAYR